MDSASQSQCPSGHHRAPAGPDPVHLEAFVVEHLAEVSLGLLAAFVQQQLVAEGPLAAVGHVLEIPHLRDAAAGPLRAIAPARLEDDVADVQAAVEAPHLEGERWVRQEAGERG